MPETISHRYEFVYLFDVENGNPNGDPDAGNMPRLDPETSHGIVTDVCLKRKIRNFIQIAHGDAAPNLIFVQEKAILNNRITDAYDQLGIDLEQTPTDPADGKKRNKKGTGQGSEVSRARDWMCANYFDIRTFGAVMSTGPNAGQVRGPVQLNFARSLDPILPLEVTITRMAVATAEEAEKQSGDNRTMGRKHVVPYGLYRVEGYVSAHLARQTGFSEGDLTLLWEALMNMFDHDHSAARGKMCARKLIVFEHESALGNAPAHVLFELITAELKSDMAAEQRPPRTFADYKVGIDRSALPAGVTVIEML